MHLIFLHGVPGVGKRTIAIELAKELDYPFLNFQHLAALLGPVLAIPLLFSTNYAIALRRTSLRSRWS
ncbi:MAG TPA: hypothetical protein DCM54_13735 [Gammaproteobacteria bacterium]|nr:hypothetical protein [Gammaproteobacteria bacterium]|tara:strand:- start:666 stop:869 length:204 start_codon:yes stop_codon:yes gene_type:complete